MEDHSIKKNFILSTLYQILTVITPFITAPYISRVLGASGVGIYSYTYSIETYFSMFAALGTISYGTREISRNRDNLEKRSILFWEIEYLSIITTIICLVGWAIWILANNNSLRIYYIVLTIYLFATMFDISWFYMGIEQFRCIVFQNSIFKIVGIIAIFLFVKDKNDTVLYVAIMALSMFLGNISMWIYLPGYIIKVKARSLHIYPHFKETLIYFIPTIATSIYTVLDKTLIGLITQSSNENGYYEQATKIVNICKSLTFTSLNSVLGSRISYLYFENKYDEIKKKIVYSMNYVLFFGIGICFGLIGISNIFVPIFFGDGYEEVIILLKLLSPIVIIIGVSNTLGSQYYNPAGLRKQSAKYIIIGSVINLTLNLVLIPTYKSAGAVIASLFAELIISALYIKNCSKIITLKEIYNLGWKKILSALLMLLVICWIDFYGSDSIVKLIVQIALGGMTYLISLSILKDSFLLEIKSYINKKYYDIKKL